MSKSWTKEEDIILADLYAQNKSASEIGAILGRTRNSVIGRGHRLLGKREHTLVKVKVKPKPTINAPRGAVAAIQSLMYSQCKFPLGGDNIYFCKNQRVDGRPYCAEHVQIAYRPRKQG